MHIPFSKYAGCGNDFIFIDNRDLSFKASPGVIQTLCLRKTGIGADGVICLEKGDSHPFKMRIYNSDGSEAEMCGNGLRCLKLFLEELGIMNPSLMIETKGSVLEVSKAGLLVKTTMGTPTGLEENIELDLGDVQVSVDHLDTGVPHAVHYVQDIEKVSVTALGAKIRRHPHFKKGANANFVQITGPSMISIRTFERGVEDETLACGTGAAASAILAALRYQMQPPIHVATKSGDKLIIDFKLDNKTIREVSQTGPAQLLFQGTFSLHNYKDEYVS